MKKWLLLLVFIPELAFAQNVPAPPSDTGKIEDDLNAKFRQVDDINAKIAQAQQEIATIRQEINAKLPQLERAQAIAAQQQRQAGMR